jgi:hypothetical protein
MESKFQRGYPLSPTSSRGIWSTDDVPVRCRPTGGCLLHQAEEELASMRRRSAIEAEREFVQVVVQMLRADRALVSTQKPSFHQGGDTVDARHQFVRPARAPFYVADLVSISLFLQTVVSEPAVGVDHRTLDDRLLDEGKQACPRDIGNSPQPNTSDPIAFLFSRYGHNGFLLGLSAARALLGATHVGLVNLDPAFKTIPPRANHGGTKLVKPQPRGLVEPEPEDLLQPESTCSRLLAGGQPIALNHSLSGLCVFSNRVPAVIEVS